MRGDSALPKPKNEDQNGPSGLDGLEGGEPTPQEATLLAEEVETLLGRLR